MYCGGPPCPQSPWDRIGRYGQFAQIETIVSTGTDLFGGVGPSSLPPRALWETGKHNWCMCQDNTGILILRLIPRRSWFVAIVPGCASRAVCETACGGNRRFEVRLRRPPLGIRYRWMCTTNLLRQDFWNVAWWNEIKWTIRICKDSLLRTVLVHRRWTTFSASRVPEPPFGLGCVKLVWKHHAPTLQIRRR